MVMSMVNWFRTKQKTNTELVHDEIRKELVGLRRNFSDRHIDFCAIFCNVWRDFINSWGKPSKFLALDEASKIGAVNDLLDRCNKWHAVIERNANQKEPCPVEVLFYWSSCRLIHSYIISLMDNDKQWEREIAPQLDRFVRDGWTFSASIPRPGSQEAWIHESKPTFFCRP
jgi:hypothetical protein